MTRMVTLMLKLRTMPTCPRRSCLCVDCRSHVARLKSKPFAAEADPISLPYGFRISHLEFSNNRKAENPRRRAPRMNLEARTMET